MEKNLFFQFQGILIKDLDAGGDILRTPIGLKQIFEPFLQIDHLIMEDPFVGIMHQDRLIQLSIKVILIFQADMEGYDAGHPVIAHGPDHSFPDQNMVALGFNTFGLGDIMEQGPGFDQGQIQIRIMGDQVLAETKGHPGHLKAVGLDLGSMPC